jgi:flavin reductase (DIM6/NTAB) family NADH-FMN oxidoreductase RutF
MTLSNLADIFDTMLDPPLWLVTAAHGPERAGLVATFVSNASLVPDLPRVVVGLAKHHHTHAVIERSRCFALHLIDETRLDWVPRFGLQSGHTADKFAGLEAAPGTTGSPLLPGAVARMECRIEASLDTGDRTFYLAEVVRADHAEAGRPLKLARMLRLLSEDYRQQLQARLQHDIALDAEAIRAWRRARQDSPGVP